MKHRMLLRLGVLAAAVLGAAAANASPMTVTTTNNASTLADALAGTGVTISNATYTGASGASGTFTGGTGAGVGIDQGIVLTTGLAASAGKTWATNNGVPSTGNGTPGSPQIPNSFDAVNLSFHFASTSTTASFKYFFASAEYSNFVNSQFNDQFTFLFNGNNIALIPGTNLPVAINNVNNGGPHSPGTNPSNTQFFVDNIKGQKPDFNYAGLTTVLDANITGLTPDADNVISLIIADVSDSILDSAVFIEAGSFTNVQPPTSVPEPASLALFAAGLVGLGFLRRGVRA